LNSSKNITEVGDQIKEDRRARHVARV